MGSKDAIKRRPVARPKAVAAPEEVGDFAMEAVAASAEPKDCVNLESIMLGSDGPTTFGQLAPHVPSQSSCFEDFVEPIARIWESYPIEHDVAGGGCIVSW